MQLCRLLVFLFSRPPRAREHVDKRRRVLHQGVTAARFTKKLLLHGQRYFTLSMGRRLLVAQAPPSFAGPTSKQAKPAMPCDAA